MVTVTVFFEGGTHPNDNSNSATVDNTARLRESFNKLLNAGLVNENVRVQATPAYSITNVVKIREENVLLLMDSDGGNEIIPQRLKDNNLTNIADTVFFMVQRMEAWILSQPAVIEQVFVSKKKENSGNIADDPTINGIHPESIVHPDRILNTILNRFFAETKGGKTRNLKYRGGKLKIAPDLLEALDIQKLSNTFSEVDRLLKKINTFG